MCHWQTSLVYTGEHFHCQILANVNGFTLANIGEQLQTLGSKIKTGRIKLGEQQETLAQNWGTLGKIGATLGQHWEYLSFLGFTYFFQFVSVRVIICVVFLFTLFVTVFVFVFVLVFVRISFIGIRFRFFGFGFVGLVGFVGFS